MKLFIKKLIPIYFVILAINSSAFAQSETISTSNSVTVDQSEFFSKDRWGASYSNYMNGQAFSKPSGSSVNHYLSLKHKFKSGWALSGVFRPDSNYDNGKEAITMGDHYAKIDYPTLFDNGNGLSVKGNLRYYAPTSESSQMAKLNGIVAPYFQVGQKAGNLELTYILIPKVYLNTVTKIGQKLVSQGHWLAASYKLSKLVKLDMALYPAWTYSRGQEVAFNDVPAYPGFTVNIADNFSVSPYVEVYAMKPDQKTTSTGGTLNYTFL